MNKITEKIRAVFQDKNLVRRIAFTFGMLLVFRFLSVIPVPNINIAQLQSFFANNQFLGLLNVFSGGGLSTLSIVMLGVGPYITGSIIMQLLTIMIPSFKELYQNEGEAGRRKFAQYSRLLTVPLAFVQAFSFILLLEKQGLFPHLGVMALLTDLLIIVAGSILTMWIGELITEFGVGNGLSLIIFAGIVARLPQIISQVAFTFDVSQIPLYAVIVAIGLIIVYAVVLVTEAERPIPVTYAKRVRGNKIYGGTSTYLPLRLNQSGVIPIIFALSILLFPQLIFNYLSTSHIGWLSSASAAIVSFLGNQLYYGMLYFLFVFLFTYFYTAVTFDPETIATNLQKNGAFIPGVRPGQPTQDHLSKILLRITLVGALFLGVIAVLPLIVRALTGITALTIGGTALLIVVSVIIDLIKKIDAQITMREY